MKPRLFTDAHISAVAVKQLRLKGVDVVRCEDVHLERAEDPELLEYATQQGRVMVSCDRDFELLHYAWMGQVRNHAGIILMSQEHHCQSVSEIIRIVMFYHDLADTETDLSGRLWLGDDAQ